MQTVLKVFLGNLSRCLFQNHEVDARNGGSIIVGTSAYAEVGDGLRIACHSHIDGVFVRIVMAALIYDAVTSCQEFHRL